MAGNIKQVMTSDEVLHNLEVDLTNYYDKSETDTLLSAKADASSVYNKSETDLLLAGKADNDDIYTKAQLDTLFDSKANVNTVYTKGETDLLLTGKADVSTTYTKSETDTLLLGKADSNDVYPKSQTYSRTQTDDLLATKADNASVYSKSDIDTALGLKADASDVYTKTETDVLLGAKADSADVYTITQTDALLDAKADLDDSSTTSTVATWSADKLHTEFQNVPKLDTSNTFEGALTVIDNAYRNTNTNIDLTDTPSEAKWGLGGYVVSDVNNTRIAYIQPLQNTDGSIDLRIDIDTNNNPNGRVLVNGERVATVQKQFTVASANLWSSAQGASVTIPKSAWYQVGVSSGYVSTNPDVSGAIPKSCLVYGPGSVADYRNYFLEKGIILYCTSGAGHDLYELSTS